MWRHLMQLCHNPHLSRPPTELLHPIDAVIDCPLTKFSRRTRDTFYVGSVSLSRLLSLEAPSSDFRRLKFPSLWHLQEIASERGSNPQDGLLGGFFPTDDRIGRVEGVAH